MYDQLTPAARARRAATNLIVLGAVVCAVATVLGVAQNERYGGFDPGAIWFFLVALAGLLTASTGVIAVGVRLGVEAARTHPQAGDTAAQDDG